MLSSEARGEYLPRLLRRGLERIEISPILALALIGEEDFPEALFLPFLLTTRQSEEEGIGEALEVPATRGIEEGPASVLLVDELSKASCLPFSAPEVASVSCSATG